jgi:Cytolethal distending toxin A/C domain
MNATIRLGLSSVLLMLAGGLAAYAPAASAQTSTLKNTGNGRCLATNGSGATLTQICSGAVINPQVWAQVNTGSGFLIRNIGTGRCLDNNAAGNVFTSPCNAASATQRWVRLNTSARAARFRSIGTNRYFGSSSTGAVISSFTPSGALFVWQY